MTTEINNSNNIDNENTELKPDEDKPTEVNSEITGPPAVEEVGTKEETAANSQETTEEKKTEEKARTTTGNRPENQTQRQSYSDRRRDYQRSDSSQRYSRFKRKVCRFCTDKNAEINYKDSGLLERFITDRGKILPRRVTGTCARHQRDLAKAIKRARIIALIPYVEK